MIYNISYKAPIIFRVILYIFKKVGNHKYVAMVNPFTSTIYISKEALQNSKTLLIHEAIHVEQIAREGRIKFILNYLYQTLRYGYRGNKYEVEAYNEQTKRTVLLGARYYDINR